MKILFMTAHPYMPQMLGGLQASAHALISSVIAKGHEASLLCGLMGEGWTGLRGRIIMKLLRIKAAQDTNLGYPVWRAWFPWESVEFVADRMKPDLIVVLARQPVRMALAAQKTGIPILMMLQDVEFSDHGGDFASLGRVPCVANSRFTAEKYRQAFEVDPLVIHPMIDGNKYRTDTTRENVTFINPHPLKGLDLALSLAEKCPDIPFSFIETWPLSADQRSDLLNRISARPNVRLNPSVTDMKKIYGATKILLAPSRWEEAYGRVASEAQFSGIPVIASNRGGLPEAVGDGGVLLDPDGPIEGWIEALQNLWNNHEYYNEVSNKASLHSRRPALNLDYQIEQWVNAFHSAIDAKN